MVPRTGHRLSNPDRSGLARRQSKRNRHPANIPAEAGTEFTEWPDFVRFTRTWIRVSSHDWHVQPCCQRPDRIPPERRVQVPQNQSGAPRISFGASSETSVSTGLPASRDEPFENSANCRFLSTTDSVIFLITFQSSKFSAARCCSALPPGGQNTHGQKA
jgi:hypothetical protein